MKRILAFLSALFMLTGLLASCGQSALSPVTAEEKKSETKGNEEETEMEEKICQTSDPAEDDTLNILMIGSSFCYYYVEELHGMLKAAGIKSNVCNVYYSGCPLEKHWTWWRLGEAHYDYFITNDGGRTKTPARSLDWCLKQKNWDIISLQESTSRIYTPGAEKHLETSKRWRTDLWKYLKEQFPKARHLWHQPWAKQIGTNQSGAVTADAEQQQYNADQIREYAVSVCKELKLERVNSGEAWQIVRREHGYDNLCARLGIGENHAGDNSHDGDVGGGQYLNACVWFEVITGQSCIGNTNRPDYRYDGEKFPLSEDLIQMLQESAHKAVGQR